MRGFISVERRWDLADNPVQLTVRLLGAAGEVVGIIPVILDTDQQGAIDMQDFEALGGSLKEARLRLEKGV